MKTPAILTKWFPPNRYELAEEFNRQSARAIFSDSQAASWGAGRIGNTGYTRLAQLNPDRAGEKIRVIVCKNELLGDLLNNE